MSVPILLDLANSRRVTNLGLKNKDGVDIRDVWKTGIKSYLGMSFEGFPNCFMIYSPHGMSELFPCDALTFPAPTALSNGPTIIEAQADMIMDTIKKLEAEKIKSINPTDAAQEEWVDMVDKYSHATLFPLTNSWWTGGNIPGKKVQMLTYVMGIEQYEAQCRGLMDEFKGFDVQREVDVAA